MNMQNKQEYVVDGIEYINHLLGMPMYTLTENKQIRKPYPSPQ
jgi:hypothetical protein